MPRLLLGLLVLLAAGQSINFFSTKQDVEIGSESAKEAEQTLQLVGNGSVANRYVGDVGRRVTQNRSLPPFRYQFRIVNSKDINSAGFPGGAIYINRGLLEMASTDDEVAAIVAHEVSHVASRHGTAQLSRQLLVQAPISIAAGVPASQVWRDEIAKLGIALGMDAPFLRYSREQEVEACVMAVRLMAEARFDPNAFRTLLEKIGEAQTGDNPRAPAFIFNHPQAQSCRRKSSRRSKSSLRRLAMRAPARSSERSGTALLRLAAPPAKSITSADSDALSGILPNVFSHPMDYYRLGYPAGWQVTRTPPTAR